MSLRGLPDFYQPIQQDGLQLFYPFEDGMFVLAPEKLEVAPHDDGRPDFSLEFVRGLQHSGYGVLDFRMRPSYRMDEGLALLRARQPGSSLGRVVFTGGFLRFQPAGEDVQIPKDLLKPAPLGWNDLGVARFIMKTSFDAATMLKAALESEMLLIMATAEMEMTGVSPRIPVRVRFDPAKLLGMLNTLANKERLIARDDLEAFFRKDRTLLPLEITGEIDEPRREDFAATMADRVRSRFGKTAASPVDTVTAYLALVSPEESGSGSVEWNLAEPVSAQRTLVLNLHPLDEARKVVKEKGVDAIFRETTVPAIPTGSYSVTVNTNLPAERSGVLALGVTLRAAPHPPQRVQAVTTSVQFKPQEDLASVLLRLAPTEKLAYSYTTFVVMQQGTTIKRLDGQTVESDAEILSLNQNDFPVIFIPIEAESSLLEVAAISGFCRWLDDGAQREQKFDLDIERTTVTPTLPKGISDATIEFTAREREGDRALKLGPFPAAALRISLFSFPDYGPHRLEIECAFDDKSGLFALELLPEGRLETASEITTLALTRSQPKKEWTWFADSPFHPGYRYRPLRKAGEAPAAWSVLLPPGNPLKINAGAGSAQ